jgi:hypothetical protein
MICSMINWQILLPAGRLIGASPVVEQATKLAPVIRIYHTGKHIQSIL